MANGQITHIELPSDDLERAQSFYSGLFGWQMQNTPEMPNYAMFQSGPGESGGAIGLRGETAPERMRFYVEVEALDATVARALELGGSVAVEITDVPGMGRYAAVFDTEGNEIGLWENAPA
jgi:predicted enzyme related to lactoylglutathione lyase